MMKKALMLLLSAPFVLAAFGQRILIHGKEGNRPLTWDDFKGRPNAASEFYANTGWKISYTMPPMKVTRDPVPLTGFVVTLELDKEKSWVKKGKETPALLKHEQTHFDIGRLCLMELVTALGKTSVVPSELSKTIAPIFNSINGKYHQMGVQYDLETNHSVNKEAQERWEVFVARELVRMAGGQSLNK
jgi:hypothetical protein